jgi:DNA (cytosine-5)-methyltransferase 3A
MVAEPVRVGSLPRPNGELSQSQAFRIYDVEGKSVNINAGGGGAGGKTGLYAIPVNTTDKGKSQTIKAQYQQTSPINIVKYKLTYGASGVAEPIEWDEQYIPVKAVSGADGKSYAVYKVKDGIITIKGKEYPIKLADGFYIIRKLTVRECMRLQTVPEWYDFSVVSNAQAYKMLGNGWTVDVIAHILSYIH